MNYPALITWLLAQIDSDLTWAQEASRKNDETAAEGGVHWRWGDADEEGLLITPDPGASEFVGTRESVTVSLRSAEVWPTDFTLPLPQFAIPYAEEIPSAVGGHIVRHDPARVIRDLTARRRSVLLCQGNLSLKLADAILRDMAETYAERSGYLDEWKPRDN